MEGLLSTGLVSITFKGRVLLSASVERFFVSRMRDFSIESGLLLDSKA